MAAIAPRQFVPQFDQHQPGLVTGYQSADATVVQLEEHRAIQRGDAGSSPAPIHF